MLNIVSYTRSSFDCIGRNSKKIENENDNPTRKRATITYTDESQKKERRNCCCMWIDTDAPNDTKTYFIIRIDLCTANEQFQIDYSPLKPFERFFPFRTGHFSFFAVFSLFPRVAFFGETPIKINQT